MTNSVDRDYYLKSSLFSEIDILKALKSPNIVGFLDVMESKNCYYIIQ
jgi:serine/threonine protein kinase